MELMVILCFLTFELESLGWIDGDSHSADDIMHNLICQDYNILSNNSYNEVVLVETKFGIANIDSNGVSVLDVIVDEYGLKMCSVLSIIVNLKYITQMNDLSGNNLSDSSILARFNDVITKIISMSNINVVIQILYDTVELKSDNNDNGSNDTLSDLLIISENENINNDQVNSYICIDCVSSMEGKSNDVVSMLSVSAENIAVSVIYNIYICYYDSKVVTYLLQFVGHDIISVLQANETCTSLTCTLNENAVQFVFVKSRVDTGLVTKNGRLIGTNKMQLDSTSLTLSSKYIKQSAELVVNTRSTSTSDINNVFLNCTIMIIQGFAIIDIPSLESIAVRNCRYNKEYLLSHTRTYMHGMEFMIFYDLGTLLKSTSDYKSKDKFKNDNNNLLMITYCKDSLYNSVNIVVIIKAMQYEYNYSSKYSLINKLAKVLIDIYDIDHINKTHVLNKILLLSLENETTNTSIGFNNYVDGLTKVLNDESFLSHDIIEHDIILSKNYYLQFHCNNFFFLMMLDKH